MVIPGSAEPAGELDGNGDSVDTAATEGEGLAGAPLFGASVHAVSPQSRSSKVISK